MVRVALDVDHLRRDVLGFIANRINNDATAYRTVRARGSRFCRARNLELAKLRICWRQIKPKKRESSTSQCAGFQKISAAAIHGFDLPSRDDLSSLSDQIVLPCAWPTATNARAARACSSRRTRTLYRKRMPSGDALILRACNAPSERILEQQM